MTSVLGRFSFVGLIGCLLLGLVIGGLGWHAWDAHRADAQHNGVIQLVAGLESRSSDANGVQYEVRLLNLGPSDVALSGLRLGAADGPYTRTQAVLLPGKALVLALNAAIDCNSNPAGAPGLYGSVRTRDGQVRTVPVVVLNPSRIVANPCT